EAGVAAEFQQGEVEAAVGLQEDGDVAGGGGPLDLFGGGAEGFDVLVAGAVYQCDDAGDLQHAAHLTDLVEVVRADGHDAEAAVADGFQDALVDEGEHGLADGAVGHPETGGQGGGRVD